MSESFRAVADRAATPVESLDRTFLGGPPTISSSGETAIRGASVTLNAR